MLINLDTENAEENENEEDADDPSTSKKILLKLTKEAVKPITRKNLNPAVPFSLTFMNKKKS
jgi:hypothetical protein